MPRTAPAHRFTRVDEEFDSDGDACRAWRYLPDEPRGVTIVMAHGLGAIKEVGLDCYAGAFAENGYDVLAFDYRGFGASDGSPRQHISIAKQLDDWRRAVGHARELTGQPIVLWAPSLSGGHVVTLAAELDVLAAIVQAPLGDGLAAASRTPVRHQMRLLGHAIIDLLGQLLGREHRVPISVAPGELGLLAHDSALRGLRVLTPDGVDWPNEVTARSLFAIAGHRPLRHASRVQAPLLVVLAADDELIPIEAARAIARRAPRGRMVSIAGDHYAAFEQPGLQESLQAQLQFLAECQSHLDAGVNR